MLYREYAPCAALTAYVRRVWTMEVAPDARVQAEPVFPDGSMELVFHLGPPFVEVKPDGAERRQQASFVVGQMHRPLMLRPEAGGRVLGVRFHPGGAYPFLRFPQTEIAGQLLSLDAVWGAEVEHLTERLRGVSWLESVARLEAFLLARLDPVAAAAFHGLAAHGVGERQNRRRFRQMVGLSARDLEALRRFQRALRLVPRVELAEAAAACGYYDQSHMALDFRRFAGVTPSAWRGHQQALTASFVSEAS